MFGGSAMGTLKAMPPSVPPATDEPAERHAVRILSESTHKPPKRHASQASSSPMHTARHRTLPGRADLEYVHNLDARRCGGQALVDTARRDDQRVSMELVRTRLARLAEHPPGCCPLCAAAAKVAPADA